MLIQLKGLFIIGVIVQTTAVSASGASSILGGRFVTGMAIGSLSMIVPVSTASVTQICVTFIHLSPY